MNRNSKLLLAIGLLAILASITYTIRGIYVNRIPVLALDKATIVQEYDYEKPRERVKIDKAINDYLTLHIGYKLINGSVMPAHTIYGFQAGKKDILAYAWCVQKEFKISNGLIRYGAFISRPAAIMLIRSKIGEFSVKACTFAVEGDLKEASIAELFPKEYHDRLLNRENEQELVKIVDNSIAALVSASDK